VRRRWISSTSTATKRTPAMIRISVTLSIVCVPLLFAVPKCVALRALRRCCAPPVESRSGSAGTRI
jgi:hypothetical protein